MESVAYGHPGSPNDEGEVMEGVEAIQDLVGGGVF